jgi:hypothetical protein
LKNILFIFPILIGIGVASYYLYLDYHPRAGSGEDEIEREIVGEILFTENNVKRQLGDDVMWNAIERKTPVYSRDSIRTGEDSAVGIKLADSTMIEVAENSLIVLDKSMQNLSINFKAGDITTKNVGKEFEVKVKDSVVRGAGADMKLRTGPDSKTSIEVAKGKATVTGKDLKSFELNQAERIGFDESGVSAVSKIAVVLRTPENKSKIQSNLPNVAQAFTWEVTRPDVRQEQLDISLNSRFTPDTTRSYRGHQAITASLSQGTYFWRVGWSDKGKTVYSDVRQLTIGRDSRLELVYPESGSSFTVEPQENSVDLQWNCAIPVKAFVAEISATADFRNIVYNRTLAETKLTVRDLPSKNYYWRVRAFGEKNEELAVSPVHTFNFKIKLPMLPELVKPAADAVWDSANPVELAWKKIEKAVEYRLTISHDPEQKDIVKTLTMNGVAYSWRWQTQGIYYWGVKAVGAKSLPIGQSETRKLVLRTKQLGPPFLLLNPKEKSEVLRDMSEDPEPVLFQWQILRPLPGPVSLVVSQTEDFKEPIRMDNLTLVSQSVKLKKPGIYFWKLVSTGADLKSQETSQTSSFNLKIASAAQAPQPIEPGNKEVLEITEPAPVKFSWNPVAGVAQYHIVVQRLDPRTGDKIPVMDRLLKEPTVTSGNLVEGIYIWTLSTMDAQGQEGVTSRPYEFTLAIPEQMAPPKLNAPVIK